MKLVLAFVLLAIVKVQAQTAPPAIVIRPPDSTVAETKSVRFTCAAYGVPTPTIAWSRGAQSLDALLADSGSGFKVYTQMMTVNSVVFAVSVLEICGTDMTSNSQFACTASNGVFGNGVAPATASFSLTVTAATKEAPGIVTRPSDQTVDYGSTVEAVCIAYGNPLPTITWTKVGCANCDFSQGMDDSLVTNEIISYGDSSFTKSTLRLCNVQDDSDSGTYMCTASNGVLGNGVSQSSRQWQLSVNARVTPTTATSMTSSGGVDATVGAGDTSTFVNVADERAYQVVVGIESVVIVFLIVIIAVLIFVAFRMTKKQKEKATIEIPAFSKASAQNPIYANQPTHQQPAGNVNVDDMTYAELAAQMGGGDGGDDMDKSLID